MRFFYAHPILGLDQQMNVQEPGFQPSLFKLLRLFEDTSDRIPPGHWLFGKRFPSGKGEVLEVTCQGCHGTERGQMCTGPSRGPNTPLVWSPVRCVTWSSCLCLHLLTWKPALLMVLSHPSGAVKCGAGTTEGAENSASYVNTPPPLLLVLLQALGPDLRVFSLWWN